MTSKVGLFGGSFNPIHNGHLMVATEIRQGCALDRMVLLPSAHPPHKTNQELLAPHHRLRMVELAIADDPNLELSSYDSSRAGPTYTIDTILYFQKLFGEETSLYWIIGADSLNELATWHRASELVDLCRIITAGRPGNSASHAGQHAIDWSCLGESFSDEQIQRLRDGVQDTPELDISSTSIRDRVCRGEPIDDLVPPSVCKYIKTHELYVAG